MWNAIEYDYTWAKKVSQSSKETQILWLQRQGAHLVALHVGKWFNTSWTRSIYWNNMEQLFRDGSLGVWRIK